MKKIFGLVGYPLGHSLSPVMHNAAFRTLGIDAEYKLFPLKDDVELRHFFSALKENNIYGVNVTVPHKQKVLNLNFPIGLSHEAQLIGAVNVAIREDSILKGYNVDGLGFIKHLKEELNFNPKDKLASLIGSGGGASAVVTQLALEGAKSILIYDIDSKKSLELVKRLNNNFPKLDVKAVNSIVELNSKSRDLLINATPIGLKEADPCLIEEELINPRSLVYDLIYNPKETKFLKTAKQAGAKTSNGLGMLLYQGVLSFELFSGKKAPVDVMKEALERAL
ncbi:MAG: shikimate dehydrogenase [Candidatus Omnitrophota bacterium]